MSESSSEDVYTFVPEDQPQALARLVVDFTRAHGRGLASDGAYAIR
jgi:hypothetical protein